MPQHFFYLGKWNFTGLPKFYIQVCDRSDRKQKICVGGTHSQPLPVTYRVPQGSIDGPTAYVLLKHILKNQSLALATFVDTAPSTFFARTALFSDKRSTPVNPLYTKRKWKPVQFINTMFHFNILKNLRLALAIFVDRAHQNFLR